MAKPKKITEKGDFDKAVERAVADYDRLRADAEWSQEDLKEIAKSSAIDEGLSYDGFEVGLAIVQAICAMADTKLPKTDGARALDVAWEEYRRYF